MPGNRAWYSTKFKLCTYCGGALQPHDCNCCSCNKKGTSVAWRCTTTCYTRSDRYADKTVTGESAAIAWAQHRNHGVFCSKKCHDADARRQRDEALKLEAEYQWLKNGKELVRTANATLRTARREGKRKASASPGAASHHRKTFGI